MSPAIYILEFAYGFPPVLQPVATTLCDKANSEKPAYNGGDPDSRGIVDGEHGQQHPELLPGLRAKLDTQSPDEVGAAYRILERLLRCFPDRVRLVVIEPHARGGGPGKLG